ncbi:hypothetical protein BP5796_09444 [Coleophoma crateriformis]|uniref:AB hydrolase-1 domain-containing protein n=1 Tax=Coleophoma crateriformis TaxID=565419 RepID=A0A3D8QY54_9HELO|nr:hypothetical protein BP5796_09444 [Coleophoma crateriformis]
MFSSNSQAAASFLYSDFVQGQKFVKFDSFRLESGVLLEDVAIAYKTWGILNTDADNCMVICHALSGSSDISDWWGPLLGPGRAFDTSRYFVFCANVLGSPYGSTSSLSFNPNTGRPYGPDFPQTTIRDDARIHKLVLDTLGVKSVASVIGGSMGGMATLEWPLCTPKGYVKSIIPIATSADHSSWGIAWAEAQRQCIFADPTFQNGHYVPTPDSQPVGGLAAARMVAMLTYRSSSSFDTRFGRKSAISKKTIPAQRSLLATPPPENNSDSPDEIHTVQVPELPQFSTQSYLRYQGDKFIRRFDANCYIHLTHKMDSHDVMRGRIQLEAGNRLALALSSLPLKTLVIGVVSDVLFTPEQQRCLADALPEAKLVMLNSLEGHDGFLLAFNILNPIITGHLMDVCSWIYQAPPLDCRESLVEVKESLFGEVEGQWE